MLLDKLVSGEKMSWLWSAYVIVRFAHWPGVVGIPETKYGAPVGLVNVAVDPDTVGVTVSVALFGYCSVSGPHDVALGAMKTRS